MNVPVLPTPALQWTRMGSGWSMVWLMFRMACTMSSMILVSSGAVRSAHFLVWRWVTWRISLLSFIFISFRVLNSNVLWLVTRMKIKNRKIMIELSLRWRRPDRMMIHIWGWSRSRSPFPHCPCQASTGHSSSSRPPGDRSASQSRRLSSRWSSPRNSRRRQALERWRRWTLV